MNFIASHRGVHLEKTLKLAKDTVRVFPGDVLLFLKQGFVDFKEFF